MIFHFKQVINKFIYFIVFFCLGEFVVMLLTMMGRLSERDIMLAASIFDKLDYNSDGKRKSRKLLFAYQKRFLWASVYNILMIIFMFISSLFPRSLFFPSSFLLPHFFFLLSFSLSFLFSPYFLPSFFVYVASLFHLIFPLLFFHCYFTYFHFPTFPPPLLSFSSSSPLLHDT